MALSSFCWVTRTFLLIHIGESLSSIVDNLIRSFEQLIDLMVYLQLAIVLVHVANLAILVGCPDVFFEIVWV